MDDAMAKVLEELRRLGRATIAAQAAAEACLEAVDRLDGRVSAGNDGGPSTGEAPSARSLLEHLIPVFDALERSTASAAKERVGPPWARRPTRGAEALRVLSAQLQVALTSAGVQQIREVNVPFDEDAHHAVERREERGLDTARVRALVAPGYTLGDHAIREAHVVVGVPTQSKE